ncbi:SNPH protein, partial [Atractosteus spatula]|nr:SNPH protein [Atractosteus spatula]
MFYTQLFMCKRGPLAKIWLAAHWEKKITKAHVYECNLEDTVKDILSPKVKIALRTSGHLLLGVVRIYSKKAKYLLADCNEAVVKIRVAFRPDLTDLPIENAEATYKAITLAENFHDFESQLPAVNTIEVTEHFTLNQCRNEDITLREDYGNNFLLDDNFGVEIHSRQHDLFDNGVQINTDDSILPSFESLADRLTADGFGDEESGFDIFTNWMLSIFRLLMFSISDLVLNDEDTMQKQHFNENEEKTMSSLDINNNDIQIQEHVEETSAVKETVLLEDEDQGFALEPVAETSSDSKKRKRKRKLVVDQDKELSNGIIREQIAGYSDIVTTFSSAPPLKKLMSWKENGGVDKLFRRSCFTFINSQLFEAWELRSCPCLDRLAVSPTNPAASVAALLEDRWSPVELLHVQLAGSCKMSGTKLTLLESWLPGIDEPSPRSESEAVSMSAPASRRSSAGSRRRPASQVNVRDAYGTSSLSSSSNSGSCKGSDGSPTPRRHAKYASCTDNHGIKPPTPEQYLTPLQQKEVCIRHLRARLKETLDKLQDRDTEIEELKTQLARMQEDWIEEECHRVEAQLALKEARKEIKQLKQVIDTVRSNLTEKDKGVQKYFVDINIQNKKLETLLHSMELAQNGSPKEEAMGGLISESAGGSPARSLTRSSTYTKLSDQAAPEKNANDFPSFNGEETLDSGFAGGEDGASRTDLLETGFFSEDASLLTSCTAASRLHHSSTYEKLDLKEQAIQTDFVQYNPDLDTIMEKVMKSQACSPTSTWISEDAEDMDTTHVDHSLAPISFSCAVDLTSSHPSTSVVVTGPSEEEEEEEEDSGGASEDRSPQKSYWSRHFLVDLLAVAVPIVPTVAWLCRGHRRQGQPVYNISSLLRGCCTVALHSIRKMSGGQPVHRSSQI